MEFQKEQFRTTESFEIISLKNPILDNYKESWFQMEFEFLFSNLLVHDTKSLQSQKVASYKWLSFVYYKQNALQMAYYVVC